MSVSHLVVTKYIYIFKKTESSRLEVQGWGSVHFYRVTSECLVNVNILVEN